MHVFLFVFLIGASVTAPPPPNVTAPPPPNVTGPPLPPSVALPPVIGSAFPQARAQTVGPFGVSDGGDPFDDGFFDGVRNVTVYVDNKGVTGLRVQYVTKDKFHIRQHGSLGDFKIDFVLEYPAEFINAIKGIQSFDLTYRASYVSSIAFSTSYGRTSGWFGSSTSDGTYFQLDTEGHVKMLVGFLGSSNVRINTLGARFCIQAPPTFGTNPKSEVVHPIGGDTTLTFDDGIFHGVNSLAWTSSATCLSFLRIQYVVGNSFETREHGSYIQGTSENVIKFAYPEEYIESVTISYILTSADPQVAMFQVVTMEVFTSYSTTYVLGDVITDSKKYVLKPMSGLGPKLLGFMGESHETINSIGAHFYKSSSAKLEYGLFSFLTIVGVVIIALGV